MRSRSRTTPSSCSGSQAGRVRSRPSSVSPMTVRTRVVVRGVVHGVGFRVTVARAARSRGVGGWVRNRSDGTVEAVFEGAPDAVAWMVELCREGPRGARVDAVDVADEPVEGATGFEIR